MQDAVHTIRRRPLWIGAAVLLVLAATAALVWSQQGTAGPAIDRTTGKAGIGIQSAPDVQVGGSMNRWVGINRNDNAPTTSTSFVDIPGMSVTFHTTTGNQRVLIDFQGEWFNSDRALLRAVVDGVVVSGTGDGGSPMAVNSAHPSDPETNGFNFISDVITHGGVHTVKIQYASVSGAEIFVDERSLVVQYQG